MKKSIDIFKVSSIILLVFIMLSCSNLYISKTYHNKQCYEFVDKYMQKQGWDRDAKDNKIVFKKGQSVGLTLDYDSEGLEVQVHLKKKDEDNFEVSVGNFGMTNELNQMKNRFERISSKIDEEIKEKCSK